MGFFPLEIAEMALIKIPNGRSIYLWIEPEKDGTVKEFLLIPPLKSEGNRMRWACVGKVEGVLPIKTEDIMALADRIKFIVESHLSFYAEGN